MKRDRENIEICMLTEDQFNKCRDIWNILKISACPKTDSKSFPTKKNKMSLWPMLFQTFASNEIQFRILFTGLTFIALL